MAPELRQRDLLLIDTDDTAIDGRASLVWLESWGGYCVRRVDHVPGGKLRLRCNSSVYSELILDVSEVEIAGKVSGVWREGGL